MKLYAIKDVKSSEFINVVLQKNDLMAKRYISLLVSDKRNGIIASMPEDFELYDLGDINLDNGVITPSNVVFVCNCLEVVNNESNPQTI